MAEVMSCSHSVPPQSVRADHLGPVVGDRHAGDETSGPDPERLPAGRTSGSPEPDNDVSHAWSLGGVGTAPTPPSRSARALSQVIWNVPDEDDTSAPKSTHARSGEVLAVPVSL